MDSPAPPPSPLDAHWRWAGLTLRTLCGWEPDLLRMVAWGEVGTVQFVAATLAQRLEAAAEDPELWAERLAHLPREEVLAEAWGDAAAYLLPLLQRLGPAVSPRPEYLRLVRIGQQPTLRQVLLNRTRLDPGLLMLLDSDLAPLFNPRLFKEERAFDPGVVPEFCIAVHARLQRDPHSVASARGTLTTITGWHHLRMWLRQYAEPAVPLPAPRWPGDEMFKPVLNLARVLELAREFRNCLEDRSLAYLRGHSALYRNTMGPATLVEVTWTLVGTAYLSNYQSRARKEEAEGWRRSVEARLEQAGIEADVPAVGYVSEEGLVSCLRREGEERVLFID